MNCEKNYNHPLSRVRAYAIYKRFCIFAVTSVTALYVNIFVSTPCLCYGIFFNNKAIRVLYIRLTCQQKSCFVLLHFAKFLPSFPPISSLGVTLVTAKKQHRCWNARATHTREKTSSSTCLSNDRLREYGCFAKSVFHISCVERKKCTFLRFFPSLGQYLPIYL